MKIAYVYDAVYPWVTGGVERRVWELSTRLAEEHEVHWYGLRYWDGPAQITKQDVTLHGVGPENELYSGERRSIIQALSYAFALIRPLLEEEFDVIDCQEFPYFPCFPAKLGSVRNDSTLFMTWHEVWGDYWYEYLGRKGLFGKGVERVVARLPDAHLAVSERTKQDVRRLGPKDIRVVPNGIDRETIETVPQSDEDIDILFVGRLIKEKNVDLLVDAVDAMQSTNPNLNTVILGDGPERDRIYEQINDLNLEKHVDVRSPLERHEDVLSLMKAANVFVLPSQREGFGMTVLEALACGTPVVTIRHRQNAATELVEDGKTGVISRPTAAALASAISRARTDISSDDCVATTRPYDWNPIVQELETVYKTTVDAL